VQTMIVYQLYLVVTVIQNCIFFQTFIVQVHSQLVRGQIESESRCILSRSHYISILYICAFIVICRSAELFPSRLRAKVPEKRANFNSNATDRLWGGGAPASNNWASGAGLSLRFLWQRCPLTLFRPQCAKRHSALVNCRSSQADREVGHSCH
jgi:hypothetical protein